MTDRPPLSLTMPVRASSIAGTGRCYYDIVEDLADLMFEGRIAECEAAVPDLPFQAFWGHFFLDCLQTTPDQSSSAFYHYIAALQDSLSEGDDLRGDAVQRALEAMGLELAAAAHRDFLPLYSEPLDPDQIRPVVERLDVHAPGSTEDDFDLLAAWLAGHPELVGVAATRRIEAVKAWISGETIRAEDWT